jgi:hypothetical protein
MPEPDVGIMTFNRCVAADMWEGLGRLDILAIPPRVDSEHVCCKWQLSMRTPDDPEFVPVALKQKPAQA